LDGRGQGEDTLLGVVDFPLGKINYESVGMP